MNAKIPSLAAALILTAVAAGAQTTLKEPSPFETLSAYDPFMNGSAQWASKDCQHVPCELAGEPKTATTAPELPASKPTTFNPNAPVYGSQRPGTNDGKQISSLISSINDPKTAAPRQVAADADSTPVPNAATVVHIGGDQARINSGLFTFRKTREAAEQLGGHQGDINDPKNGFATPGRIIDSNEGTSAFTGRPTRVAINTKE